VSFGVFGLGNKQYEHYCAVGKKVHKCMKELGATPIVERGDGDDDDCIDDDYDRWCASLIKALEEHAEILGQQLGDAATKDAPLEQYDVTIHATPADEAAPFSSSSGTDHHHPFLATITTVRQLHSPSSDRSCVHVEIDISGAAASYEHGDHIALYPRNSSDSVSRAASLLGVSPTTTFTLSKPSTASMLQDPFPGPMTLQTALACFTDLLASPHKEALAALASVATDAGEAAKLGKLASHIGTAACKQRACHALARATLSPAWRGISAKCCPVIA
jgi:NADPH-ferrihemoprotein reductase